MRRPSQAGQSLLEVMLAVGIFSIAAVGLTRSIQSMLDAASILRREAQIRVRLESFLDEARVSRLQVGTTQLPSDLPGVQWSKTIELMPPDSAFKEQISGLHKLILTAKWEAGGRQEKREAEIYVLQR